MALAKTTRPRLSGVLARPRLFRVLDRYADRPLTWVTGPPGSGKTTLVASYLQRARRRTLWYQMDEGDRDVATFFYYLGQASPGPRPLPPLTPEYQADLRTFARRFFRDLFDRLGPRFALVLDNHQDVASDARLNEAITTVVDEVPRGGRVLVLSRVRPPSALSRFHATRQLGVVDWPELRLTPAEARALAGRLGARSFRRETLQALVTAADGWAAGLVLLLRAPDPAARGPTGSSEPVREALFDYFADEVFRASDPVTQSVLLEVAFLPMLSGPMAAGLTGRADAGRTLDALARRHYFVQRLEADTPLYRLHPMFQAFLLARARMTLRPQRLRAIQTLAARLLAEAGHPDDAAGLLIEAQDWDGLGGLIRAHAATHVTQGRTQTLEHWLAQLPIDHVNRDAWLLYWQGMCRQPTDPGQGRELFERALAAFRKDGDAVGTWLAWAAAVDTFVPEGRDFAPLDRWIAMFDEITREVPRYPSPAIEARVIISMAGALIWRQPGHPDALAWLDRLQALAAASADPDLRIFAKHVWWVHVGSRTDSARLATLAEEIRVLSEREDASPMMRLMALFTVARSLNVVAAFDRCRQAVASGLELARVSGLRLWTPQFLGDQVAAELAEGKLEAAGRTLELMAREVAAAREVDRALYEYLSAWHALEAGDVTRAQAHIEQARWIGAPIIEVIIRALAAQVAHAGGQDSAARAHVARGLELAHQDGLRLSAFWTGIPAALIAFDSGDEQAGLRALREALPVGRAMRIVNHWPWRPRVMARLCTKALEAGIEVDYIRWLIQARRLMPEPPPIHLKAWPWPIRVFTLGRFQIVRDDVPVAFPAKVPRKPLAVLQMLVAAPHGGLPEAQLVDALWPDFDGDAALQALAMALHRLRTILAVEGALTRHGGRVALDPRLCWIDVHAFNDALANAEKALAGVGSDVSSWVEARRWTMQGVELYRGQFLGEDGVQSWAAPIADRLRARWVRHLCALVDHSMRTEQWEEAIETCQTAIEADPCAEPAYVRMMTAYVRTGRRAEALRTYERCRSVLASSLGLTPSGDLKALHQALHAP